ncbi:hypothetical protein ATO8_11489 [Roseivivax marinus]|uniref:DUF4177 domain-containing protein n=1 Tax=Roseivivax marinus TaxID=1379903 RepID=W4HJN9_9RHOB|nr:hypothetical protein ATO8_11489 [Roseivivax marinus]
MPNYEYKVLPAPSRGEKAKGVKGNEARFAHAIEKLMNEMASGGWEYQRAETLPSEERSGLTGSVTVWRTMLVFRRAIGDGDAELKPRMLEAPAPKPAPSISTAAPAAAAVAAPAVTPRDARPAQEPRTDEPRAATEQTEPATQEPQEAPIDELSAALASAPVPTEPAPADPTDADQNEADQPGDTANLQHALQPGPAPEKPSAPEGWHDNGVEETEQVRDLSAILRARAAQSPDDPDDR